MDLDDNDPVKMYVREVAKVQPLTKEEETYLFQEAGKPGELRRLPGNPSRRFLGLCRCLHRGRHLRSYSEIEIEVAKVPVAVVKSPFHH